MSDDDRISYLSGDRTDGLDDIERAELDAFRDLLADPAMWEEPAPHLEGHVLAAVTAAASSAPPSAAVDRSTLAVVIPSRQRRWTALSLVGVAAAAALVTVVLLRPDGGESFSMHLEPTELIPEASGEATLTKTSSGWRIELDATGLPRLDGGSFYQAWLKNADGTLVPVGTFNEGSDVALWAGVSPVEFPTLTVTEESDDGDQASSGRRVLLGTVSP